MVHEDPWHAGNPYIYTLIEGIQNSHPDCVIGWGREQFWKDDICSYDIVHFHWPQTFMGNDTHTETALLSTLIVFSFSSFSSVKIFLGVTTVLVLKKSDLLLD